MSEEKSLEELNTDLESAVTEHGKDSDEAKAIQDSIDLLGEKDKKTYSWEEMHEVREEAKSHRISKAKLKADYAKKEAELKKIEDEKLTSTEKDKKKITELEKNLVDIQTEYKDKEIDNLILTVASGMNFADMEIVKLLAKKELDDEDDVDKKTVENVINKIAKDKPYLLKGKESVTPGSGNFPRKGMEGEKDPDVLFGEMLKK